MEGDVSMKKKPEPLKKEAKEDSGTSKSRENNQSPAEREKHGALRKDLYLDMINALFEKYRDRVSTYYCPNITCEKTFWHAHEGYVCPECGSFGIISEFNVETHDRIRHTQPIIGCLDTIGRLICRECMQNYNTDDDVSFIVYSDTQPYSFESCDICRKDLYRDKNPAA